MVYTVFYYGSEALARAIIQLVLRLALRRAPEREERERFMEPLARPPAWGYGIVTMEDGVPDAVFYGRATGVRTVIPLPTRLRSVQVHEKLAAARPERLYFSFAEAASPQWFKQIEYLAEMLRRRGGGGEEAEG